MFFKAFEIERRSFSTDYMEWNFRSSARLRSAMIVNESDEARPRHRDEQPDQDPGHRRNPLLGHGEADSWLVRQRTGRMLDNALKMLEHAAERAAQGRLDSERNEASLHRARSESRRRGRSQGGASRAQQKSSSARSASTRRRARLEGGAVQLDSERAGARWLDDAQKLGHAAEKAAKGRQGSERSRTAPKSRATRRQVRRRGGLLREGGARHVNAEPSPVGTPLQ